MSGVALALALVLVALIARDVVLRVLAEVRERRVVKAESDEIAALRVEIKQKTDDAFRLIAEWGANYNRDVPALTEKVEGLVMRSTMGGKR